ncbi:hypothetical protein TSUD_181810 [Trifolium subterraneum]|uniref:Uncharacterized protein n=1 Tax=Trifolium subterraneum TaxID=3900 RepID=A0A2Z6NZ92_TRISU|nr:hypothetical protein TSUD_181810 [Trifolium subterraneum]
MSEAFNSVIVGARAKPKVTMIEEIIVYLMKRWEKIRQKIGRYAESILPNIKKKLEREASFSNQWMVRPAGYELFEVRNISATGDHFSVQCFKNRTGPAGRTGQTANWKVYRSGLTAGPDKQLNRCKQPGHNKQTCKQPPPATSQAGASQAPPATTQAAATQPPTTTQAGASQAHPTTQTSHAPGQAKNVSKKGRRKNK